MKCVNTVCVRLTLLRSLVALGASVVPLSAQTTAIEIRAWIDGRSRLELVGATATWQHFEFAAPGRLDCNIGVPTRPTYLDGVAWWPAWPDAPSCENRFCGGCMSDTWVGLPTALPLEAFEPRVTPTLARGSVAVVEEPTAANGFRVVLEFNDNPWGGAAWYEVTLQALSGGGGGIDRYCPSSVNSSGRAAWIDLAGSRSVGANDCRLIAGDCPPGHAALFMLAAAPAALPLGQGTLCLSPFAPGIQRLGPVEYVRFDGTVERPLDLQSPPPGSPILAGSVWNFQLMFRDHHGSGAGVNLSDAIAVTFLP